MSKISDLYLAEFGVAGTTTEVAAYAAILDMGVSSLTLDTTSTTSVDAFLEASYQAAFGRPVDTDGIAAYTTKLTDGTIAQADFMDILLAGADVYPADGAFTAENTADKAVTLKTAAVAKTALDNGLTATQAQTILATVVAGTADVAAADAAVTAQATTNDAAVAPTYTIEASAASVTEGNAITFTVTASDTKFATTTTLNYTIAGVANDVATAATAGTDITPMNGTVTIAAGSKTGTFTLTPAADSVTEGNEGFKVTLTNANFETQAVLGTVIIQDPANAGQTFTLTAGINNLTGATGNDTFDATETATPANTFTNLDTLDGGAGIDTLNIVQSGAINTTTLAGATVTNIETISMKSAAAITTNTTTWTGATSLTLTAATDVTATAAATTDITATAAALTASAGAITINGGKDVSVTSADTSVLSTANLATILVGQTTAAAGTVSVTHTETFSDDAVAGTDTGTSPTITVTGGTIITVNNNVVAGTASVLGDIATIGKVIVNGNASTTAVTVNQTAATEAFGTPATNTSIKITNGAVDVTDANTATTAVDTIATVSLSNFGLATITSSALSTLNVAGGASATTASGNLDLDKSAADTTVLPTTLNVNSTGGFIGELGLAAGTSTMAATYTAVNVASTADTTFADSTFAANKTLTVSGAGVTTFSAFTGNAALTSIVSSGGGLTIGVQLATGVAVTGGTGVENIMIGATTEAINLGAGNDVVTVSTTTMGTGGSVAGGEGTDTLVANTNTSAFSGLPAFTGFETLRVAGAAAQGAHNANGFTALELGVTAVAVSSFTNVADGVGLTILGSLAGAHTVTLADATGTTALGTAESMSLTLTSAGTLDAATSGITIAGVETFNITTTDTDTTAHTNSLTLTADSAESIVVTGNTGFDFSASVAAKVTNFDASGVQGAAADAAALAVTYASDYNTIGGTATIKGGSGNDSLTGGALVADTITGNAGVDTIVYTGGADTFTGGAGNDVFDINAAGTSTAYVTITDLTAGDTIDLAFLGTVANKAAAAMNSAEVVLGSAATMAQYLDAAAAGIADTLAWFQFEGNSYIVVDQSVGAAFVSGTDSVIKLTGSIDLSTSSITTEVLTFA